MEPIDYTFYMAAQYKIKLIVPLTDNYFYYHGDYSQFCTKRGKTKKDFWWDYTLRSDFKQYIRKWLEHTNRYTKLKVKDDPSLFLIELGNELGNIRRDNDSVPPKEWIEDITRFIKTIDTSHMILDGSDECLGKSDNFNISTIEAYRSNFYGKDYGRMDDHASSAMAKRKPFLVTEFDSKFEDDFLKHIERNKNINGSFWWCLYGKDDNGKYIRHDDGYTQYYKEAGSFNNLLRLTNHARRLQSLPEVTSLP
jgi:mannan endo-1,4-beta-mannosidase